LLVCYCCRQVPSIRNVNRNRRINAGNCRDGFIIPIIHSRGLVLCFIADLETDSVDDGARGYFFGDGFETGLCEGEVGSVVP